ncbi:Glutamate-gated chloride channel subunit beta [Portunus trituberculatus]|uniref:Glutamate-gated chloride channel subunit beta n=1 Tax=Portunus trituberculatus TaxID=210409 RepID=A0A5B7E9G5_PORTR|nr:Glutamate-gated chloride channel subunit beta [Portunus trituberculatus]
MYEYYITRMWHHLCFTYNHNKKLISTFLDGELNNVQDFVLLSPVYGNWARLGQNFEARNSFSGDLSQINVWDRVLSDVEILDFARCKTDPQGSYISWEAGWSLKVVTPYNLSLEEFCQQKLGTSYFWFPSLPVVTAHYICEALGTELPWATSITDIQRLQNVSAATHPDHDNCHFNFWTALTDITEEDVWRMNNGSLVTNIFWAPYEPNGLRYENCAALSRYGVADISCEMQIRCAVCTFKKQQRFSLYGICEQELRNVYFVAYQRVIGQVIFIGYGKYHIRLEDEMWMWVDVVNNVTMAYMEEAVPYFPMGLRWWRLQVPVCDQKEGRRQLTLSPCPSGHFTCNDATCIPIHHRCDLKYDCRDNSDEYDCKRIFFPQDYQSHLPPRLSGDEDLSLPITLDVIMETIAVKTLEMTMEVAYEIAMTWIDNRLSYLNLKANNSLNKLDMEAVRRLWIPQVNFINTDNIHRTRIDEDVVMFIDRRRHKFYIDPAAPAEVEVYSGQDNTLTIRRKYGTVYKCNFDLRLYPFDAQQCEMHLRITSELKSFLTFDPDHSSVQYLSNPFLIEYEVGEVNLVHDNSGQFSEARVLVPLTRRYGYAILTIYTPTLVLLVVSYTTLFFRTAIFDVRMMSALTVQLVIATLFSQVLSRRSIAATLVSASLPKTSYFKMVDIWLIFCIGITFLVIIYHAIVDSVAYGDDPSTPITKVWQVRPREPPMIKSMHKPKITVPNLVLFTKITTPLVFFIFNIGYWGYIFSY